MRVGGGRVGERGREAGTVPKRGGRGEKRDVDSVTHRTTERFTI